MLQLPRVQPMDLSAACDGSRLTMHVMTAAEQLIRRDASGRIAVRAVVWLVYHVRRVCTLHQPAIAPQPSP